MPPDISTEGSLLYYITIIVGALITGIGVILQSRRTPFKAPETQAQQEYRIVVDGTQGVISMEEWMESLVSIPLIVVSLDLHLVTTHKVIKIQVSEKPKDPDTS